MDWEREMAYKFREGKAEGKQEKARESAIAWLKKGMSAEDIAECEGLPLETVLELQKELPEHA